MDIYFIALFDIEWHGESFGRGDIVSIESDAVPPGTGISWAYFSPPKDLEGTPKLAHVADDGSGDLVFRYTVAESKMSFTVKARVGLPLAHAVIEPASSPRDPPPPVPKSKEPVLKFGASLCATDSRSFVGFVSKSRVKKPLIREATIYDDPLRYDDGYDPLHRGED